VPVSHRRSPQPRVHIIGPQKSFRSPITGEEIHSRVQLRQHMAEHNVVHQADYGPNNGAEYFARKAEERTDFYTGGPKLQAEIRQDLIAATEKVAQGYKPAVKQEGGDI
jgi:hypothetical protein